MGNVQRRNRIARNERTRKNSLSLYERTKELIEYLVENDGHLSMSKAEIAVALAARYDRRAWLRSDGTGDREIVERVCTLSRDQADDPVAQGICAGFVVAYAPNAGGLTLVDESGEMPLHMALHMLQGDLSQQQKYKTVWRRRLPYWAAAAKNAALSGDGDLARILWRIHDKIKETGFTPDDIITEYAAELSRRGLVGAPS